MICIIAPTYKAAERWANGHMLQHDEWFYPSSEEALMARVDYHVVTAEAGEIPNAYLNRMLTIAWKQGRRKK